MTEANSTPPIDPSNPQQPPTAAAPQPTPQPKQKRRRRWPYVILALVLLLILLVLLLPTIASTGAVRSIVVGKVNDSLRGKLAINDWSIGWTSGVTIDGLKVVDDQGRLVAEVGKVKVPASLIGLAKGNYDLGEIVIDNPNFNIETYPDGTTNLDHLAKPQPAAAEKKSEPSSEKKPAGGETKLPDVKGKIVINQLHGTISGPDLPPVNIDPSDITINIPSINSPIEDNAKIVYRVAGSPPSTISLAGTVAAIENNKVDLDKLTADQKLDVTNADFAAATPFLKKGDKTAMLAGIANGSLQIKSKGLTDASVSGGFNVDNFAYSGAALKGDTFKSVKVAMPISITTAAGGAAGGGGANDAQITIQTLKIETDQALVDVSGQFMHSVLQNLSANKAPGSAGQIAVAVSTKDLPGLVKSLPNTLGMQKDVVISSGKIAARVDIALMADKATVKQTLDAEAAGTRATTQPTPIKLDPIHLDTAVTALPNGSAIPDLRDIAINLTSAFASAAGGGKSLDAVDLKGNLDLQKLHDQLAQFSDLGGANFSGAGTFGVSSQGDLTKAGGTSQVNANLTLTNVVFKQPSNPSPLNEPRLAFIADAQLVRGEKDFIEKIPTAKVTVQSGDAQSPVLDFAATASNVGVANTSVDKFDVKNVVPDLARVQQQFGAFIPPDIRLIGGSITTTATGSFTNNTLTFSKKTQIANVTVQQIDPKGATPPKALVSNESDDVTADGSLAMPKDGSMSAAIKALTVSGNLAKATISDAQLQLARATADKDKPLLVFDMLQSAKVQVAVPDINRVMKLIPPSTQPTTQPALDIGGGAVVEANISRDAASQTTHISVPQIAASKLSLVRGKRSYAFDRPIAIKLNADLATAGDKMNTLSVKELSGDLGGLATLGMPEPIAVANLSDKTPTAKGKIGLNGDLEPLMRLLSVVQDADPMPYRGSYAVAEALATGASNAISVTGDTTINKFVVLQQDQKTAAFTEDKIVLANDLVADMNSKTATINNVALTMPSSQAAGVQLKGKVIDWEQRRQLDGVVCDLSYDLPKLWTMIKPMLAPDTQEQLKDLKIAGNFKKTFNVGGSFPATTKPGEKPIKYLTADGGLNVQLLDTSGIHLENLEVPITLKDAQLITLYMNKAKAERAAKPAMFNNGKLDVNSLVVDLNGDEPRLSTGKNQKLVSGASINSLLGDTLGKYVNPVFANSKRAQGLLDVTIVECNNLSLGQGLHTANSGNARITFSLTDMDIANPVGQLMLGKVVSAVPGFSSGVSGEADAFQGSIKDGVITIADGRTTQDITMNLIDSSTVRDASGKPVKPTVMPMTFQGDINLVNLKQLLKVSMPAQLVAKFIPDRKIKEDMVKIFPNGIPITMKGTTTKPQVDIGNIGKEIASGLVKQQVGNVIPGLNGNGSKSGSQSPGDALGGLLNQLGGKKNSDNSQTTPDNSTPDQSTPPPTKKKKK